RQRIGAVHPEMDKIGERHGVSMKFGPTSRLAWRRSEYTLLSPGLQDAAAAERVSGFVASARLESVVRPPAMVAPEAPPGSRCHRPGWGAEAQSRSGVSRRLPRAWSPTVGAPSRSCVRTAVSCRSPAAARCGTPETRHRAGVPARRRRALSAAER